MTNLSDIGRRFAQMRRELGIRRADAAKLLGCSVYTVGNFERGDKNTEGATVLAAVDLMRRWENKERPLPEPMTTVAVETLVEPLDILIGGLTNTLAMLRDYSIPLRSRLIHTRAQLKFLLTNFLSESSLPPE